MECVANPVVSELGPGTRIDRYEIIELLARGGMAEIYLVKSIGLRGFETRSVLKRLPPSCVNDEPGYLKMFLDEARLVASLRHPNIAQVFDLGQDGDSYFFVMEYLDGVDLRELIQQCEERHAPMPLASAIQIVLAVAEGLHAAHEARDQDGQPLHVVHRDVSPNNIVVTGDGAVKLIDFGVAKSSTQRARTETGVVKGKYAYMSPEQCRAEPLDRRSDIFALGVILYELTTGARPHGDQCGPELLHRIVEDDCPDPRLRAWDYPEELANIVNKVLHRNPEHRYQSAREVHQALSSFAAHRQMLLSPYELASWVKATMQPQMRASSVLHMSSPGRASTRANTVPLTGGDNTHGALDERSRLARGTGSGRNLPLALMPKQPQRRLTSLPYAEFAVGSSDAMGRDDDIEEAAALDAGPGEKKGPKKWRWTQMVALSLLAGGVVLATALAGYVQITGEDVPTLIGHLRQLAG